MAIRSTTTGILPFEVQDRWFAISLDQIEGVAPLGQVMPVPGNRSRALKGLVYMLGKIMTVIDIAPLANLGASRAGAQAIIIKYQGAYYAVLARSIGTLMQRPRIAQFKRLPHPFTPRYVEDQKRKVLLLDMEYIIVHFICT